jgi:hypothetical protein
VVETLQLPEFILVLKIYHTDTAFQFIFIVNPAVSELRSFELECRQSLFQKVKVRISPMLLIKHICLNSDVALIKQILKGYRYITNIWVLFDLIKVFMIILIEFFIPPLRIFLDILSFITVTFRIIWVILGLLLLNDINIDIWMLIN